MFEIRQIAEKKRGQAQKAQSEWDYLKQQCQLGERDYVILFPEDDKKCNYYGMLYLDIFLQREGGERAVIVTHNHYVRDNVAKLSHSVKSILCYDEEKMGRLIALYELYLFDPRFVLISLDRPYCRMGRDLIGVKGTTVEQLVAIGIYRIIPFRPLEDGDK